MRFAKLDTRHWFVHVATVLLLIVVACGMVSAQPKRAVIAVSTLFDGKGNVLKDTRIVVEGSKIVGLDPNAGPIDYDLRGLTVMPGWIDAHVHITWSFDKNDVRRVVFVMKGGVVYKNTVK
jgi:adenine deaminase